MERILNNISGCKRLAIMGGTFDPIHYGHLVTAEAVRREFQTERVLFIPTGSPPHKSNSQVSGTEHRYLMTVLATEDNPFFYTSRMEIDRPGATYTIDTIQELRKICHKDAQLYFITGADAVSDIFTWKEPEKLLTLCHFVAVTRPGYNKNDVLENARQLNSKYNSQIHFLEVPALAISSTDIRNRVKHSKAIKYLLPQEVETYIMKHGLYQEPEGEGLAAQARDYAAKALSARRMAHTQGVAGEARKLAAHYGYPLDKAEAAAYLHDCAKELPKQEIERLMGLYPLPEEALCKNYPEAAHGFLAAEMVKQDLNIEDEELLNAMRYHTTGRPDMALLEKIIFIADLIEPGRKSNQALTNLTALAYENIDEAMVFGLQYKREYCVKVKKALHPLGTAALDDFINRTSPR